MYKLHIYTHIANIKLSLTACHGTKNDQHGVALKKIKIANKKMISNNNSNDGIDDDDENDDDDYIEARDRETRNQGSFKWIERALVSAVAATNEPKST